MKSNFEPSPNLSVHSMFPGLVRVRSNDKPKCALHPRFFGAPTTFSMNTRAPIDGAEERQNGRAATPFRVDGVFFVSPRVARSSQPWAERCNPFGIERNGPARQKLVALDFQTCATTLSTVLHQTGRPIILCFIDFQSDF